MTAAAGGVDRVEREIDDRCPQGLAVAGERGKICRHVAGERHAPMLGPRADQIPHLGDDRREVKRLRRRVVSTATGLAKGEEAADLLLENGQLPRRHGEAVVGRARVATGAAAAMEIDRQPGAGDRVPQLMGEPGGELAQKPLAFGRRQARAQFGERRAQIVAARHEAADVVAIRLLAGCVGEPRTELALRDVRHMPFDGADSSGQPRGGDEAHGHEHRECGGRDHQRRPDRLERRPHEAPDRREHEERLAAEAARDRGADVVALAGEHDVASGGSGEHRRRMIRKHRGRQRRERGGGSPGRRVGTGTPDDELTAGQLAERVKHLWRERHAGGFERGGDPLLLCPCRRDRLPGGEEGGEHDVGDHRGEHEPDDRQHEQAEERAAGPGGRHGRKAPPAAESAEPGGREPEGLAGVPTADGRDEVVEPVAAVGQSAAGDVAADEIAEDPSEILVPGKRQERSGVGHHADESPQQAQVGEHVHLLPHAPLLVHEPPAAAPLNLAGNLTVLERSREGGEEGVVGGIDVVEDRAAKRALGGERGEEADEPGPLAGVADRVAAGVGAEPPGEERIGVAEGAEMELRHMAAGVVEPGHMEHDPYGEGLGLRPARGRPGERP